MLLRRTDLDRIWDGEVDVVLRRQRRPTVRAGGALRTARGVLEIVAVDPVAPDEITVDDARRAGYASPAVLLAEVPDRPDAQLYRIVVRPGGADPRIALRADDRLTADDVDAIRRRLDRMDASAPTGAWTRTVLHLIAERPRVRAPDLAASIGSAVAPFKANVRKLKALGLTISHERGYELSPRGRALLDRLDGFDAPDGS